MGFHFSIGALALAAEGANAVGAVRFTLRDEAVEIDLLRVGSYRESFLPGALTESVRFAVPYTAVRGLVRRGAVLYLALDPRVASPYHRFALTRFTDGPLDALIGAHHRRMRARLAAVLLPAPVSTLALVFSPEMLVAGVLGKASLAVVVALATWALARAALSVRTYGGPLADEFRDAFEQRMLEKLGLRPAWLADEAPFDAPVTHSLLARAESAPSPVRGAALAFPMTSSSRVATARTASRGPRVATHVAPTGRPLGLGDGPRGLTDSPRGLAGYAGRGRPPPGFPEPEMAAPVVAPATLEPPPTRRPSVAITRATPPPAAPVYEPVAPSHGGPRGPLPLAAPPAIWALVATSPRMRRAAVVALAAASLAVLALSAGRAVVSPEAPRSQLEGASAAASGDELPAGGASVPVAAAPVATPGAVVPGGASVVVPAGPRSPLPRCTCERSDSPLWSSPPPVLSILPIPTRRNDVGALEENIAPRPDARGRMRYEFDLAIVNNGKDDLSDLKLVLTFARRDDRGERAGVTDRGLFWEGALRPGRSVKWTVKAPGTEVRIDSDEKRTLADVAPADGDAYFSLLRARQSAVRLHAATMLAYVGDARAEAAALGLDGLSAAQEPVRAMVVRAASPVRVCDARVKADVLEACVYNTTGDAVSRPKLLEPSANGRGATLEDEIPPHEGLRATFPAFGTAPAELAVQR